MLWRTTAALTLAALLSGCAALNTISAEVATYNQWEDGLKPGTYVYDRLPSQAQKQETQQALEDAADEALIAVGFTKASNESQARYTVQLGARIQVQDRSPFDDPFWWNGGLYRGYYGRGYGYGTWGMRRGYGLGWGMTFYDNDRYNREVAVLIRDRKSGQVVYESHAVNSGSSNTMGRLVYALFQAALTDFPYSGPNPRQLQLPLGPAD